MPVDYNLSNELIDHIKFFNPKHLAQDVLNRKRLSELVSLCFDKDLLISSRATWVLWHCSDIDFNALIPYHINLINNLKNKNLHNGVIRNTLRLFQKHAVPKKKESFMIDICYSYIKNPNEAIAVRAFAMTIIFNISKPYPELLLELKSVLELLNHPDESGGIKSRIKNTLKDIDKVLKLNN